MTKKEYSPHQKGLIDRYYRNIDSISLQKIQELVTELYLADTAKKKENLWQRVLAAMQKLKISEAIISHIMTKKDVEILAKNVQDWLKAKK